jgi:hypothetical protein
VVGGPPLYKMVLRCLVWVVRKFVDGDIRESEKPRSRAFKEQDAERVVGFTSCARTFQRLSVTPFMAPGDAIRCGGLVIWTFPTAFLPLRGKSFGRDRRYTPKIP